MSTVHARDTDTAAGPRRLSGLPARLRARARRPAEVRESTRWLFAVLALVSLALVLPASIVLATGPMKLVTVIALVVLGLSWGAGYLRQGVPLVMDLVDAVALSAYALAGPDPTAALGLAFPALWYRSLYGSGRHAVLRCSLYAGALGASVALWPHVPGHTGSTGIGPLVGSVPTMFLTVFVVRHLAGGMGAREQAAQLGAAHALAGSRLLGVTDASEIRRIGWAAMTQMCAAFPGLRVLKVVSDGDTLRVDGASGGFAGVPARLPAASLPVLGRTGGTGRDAVPRGAELDAAAGTPCAWVCVPLPTVHDQHGRAWLLLGAPRGVPAAAIGSVDSLSNLVTLALRSSEVHHELTAQATLDNLTGLANRASFNAALSATLEDERAQDTTVLFVDLDDFKDVNDVFGHRAGDDLLREVAARLRTATRHEDLCARIGGDEFAVLLRRTGGASAAEAAQRIVQAVAVPVLLDSGVAHVGASVGVATATSETDLEQLIHRADVAMYAAKADGKARIQAFHPGLLRRDSTGGTFERELAAAAGNGELVVHYQPVLSLPDGRCTAVEALVRWQHPVRGLLHPGDFIETAERVGLIRGIDAHVLRRACADAATWRDAYPGSALAVHINISGLELDDEGFVGSVTRCLSDFALPPEQLVLELTETVLTSSSAAIGRLNALAAHGVTIAIDDFGTGYAALTTLRTLPVQIVKIDRSFVAGSLANPADRAVTEAVVNMASRLGMQTIAEGVEQLDQQRFLESIGADGVQGDLYLRPTTAEGFGAWLGEHLAGRARTRPTSAVVIPFPPRHSA